jgi:arabinose-5-phosphate isomerase
MKEEQLITNAKRVLNAEIRALENGLNYINASFVTALELIHQSLAHGKIVVTGMGKSGHVGKKIAATLASTGSPAFFVHPAEAGHGDLGMITQNDVVIAISQSGKSNELLQIIPYFKRNGIKLIAMTGELQSPLATHADVVINTHVSQEACPLGLAPTASTTLTMALGDALAMCLLEMAGFTPDNFAETHPHGTLGRRLLVGVADIMTSLEQTPMVAPEALVKEALFVMTQGSLGFVIVRDANNRAVGVFTDGDLRRCLDKDVDIKSTAIAQVMSTSFVSIQPNKLAVSAVELMEKFKISTLPVMNEDGSIAGAISMRILLQAGVV